MSLLDVRRFDSLSDQEVVRRIGSLLAVALMRSGALSTAVAMATVRPGSAKLVEADQLLSDPRDQRIVRYLECTGEARPRELAVVLGLSRGVLQRRLTRLRAVGICQVAGMTRGARYSLKTDHSAN
jgi:Winged helix-turn-helix DNA-binding